MMTREKESRSSKKEIRRKEVIALTEVRDDMK